MRYLKPILLIFASIIVNCHYSSCNSLWAQEMPLSECATVSVLTCGPGNDFYTTFGHSALRITDTAQGIDWVYNYGTFDFNTPHFYWQFTRGRLNYRLSREDFDDFMFTYQYEQRAVWEQRLNLTPQEINNLYVALEWNYRPENRYYLYDILRDNCATRVRDMVEASLSHRQLRTSCSRDGEYSYRQLLRSCMRDTLEWWQLGISIILGHHADHLCSAEESMFLPKQMQMHYQHAQIVDVRQRRVEPLTGGCRQLLPDTREPLRPSLPPSAPFGALFLLVLLLTLFDKPLRPSPLLRIIDRTLFFAAGLAGLFLLFMWVGTDHWCTTWNLNILWASPLLILVAIFMQHSPRWALWLQEALFLVSTVYVILGFGGISFALIPIILTLALRVACLIPRTPRPRRRQR